MKRTSETDIPEILVERYVLGELPADRAAALEKHPGFAGRVREIETSNEEILSKYTPKHFAQRIENQVAAEASLAASQAKAADLQNASSPGFRRRSFRLMAWALPGLAAAAVALTLGIPALTGSLGTTPDTPPLELTQIKGPTTLLVYRSVRGAATQDDQPEQLHDGSGVSQGDRLQLAYTSGPHSYGAIVSIDGRGAVTLHFPLEMSSGPALVVGRKVELQYDYTLDDAPDFERFFFVTSDSDFSVASLIQTVRAQAQDIVKQPARELHLDTNFAVTDVTLIKGE